MVEKLENTTGKWSYLDNKHWLILPIFTFLILSIETIIHNNPISFCVDDAWITIANAELILHGGIDNYGNTIPSGATSSVHLFLVTLLAPLFGGPQASFLLGVVCAALYAVGLWRLLFSVCRSPFLSACGTVVGLLASLIWYQLMNGLETGLAMAAVAWAGYFLQSQRNRPLAFLIGAMPFIRPELSVLSLFLIFYLSWTLRHNFSELVKLISSLLSVAIVLGILTWYFTGHIISPTATAKAAYFNEVRPNFNMRLTLAFNFVTESRLSYFLAGMVMLPTLRGGWIYLAYFIVFLIVSAITLPVALFHNEYRYLYTFVPFGLLGWCTMATYARQIVPVFAIVMVCVAMIFPTQGWVSYLAATNRNRAQKPVAEWAEKNLPDGARILIHDAGYFGWHSRYVATPPRKFVIIDVVGLKTPSAIHYHQQITAPSRGQDRWKAVDRIARDNMVQYAIIANVGFWGDIEQYLRRAGWTVELIYPNRDSYQIFKLTPPQK